MKEEEKKRVIRLVHKHTVDDGGCLIWTGRLSCSGGSPKLGNKSARREYYKAVKGPVKAGHYITSSCGHDLCMEHLTQVTRSDIARKQNEDPSIRARKRASSARAARARGKICMEIARQIRASTDPIDVEAAKYGVDRTLIHKIRAHQVWREDVFQANPFAGLFTGLAANQARKAA